MAKNPMKKAMELRHAKAMEKAGLPKKMVAEEKAEANEYCGGGKVKKYAGGGYVRAADGIAKRGKTRGKKV